MRKIGLETEYAHLNNSSNPNFDDGNVRAIHLIDKTRAMFSSLESLYELEHSIVFKDGDYIKIDIGFFDQEARSLEYVGMPHPIDKTFSSQLKSDRRVEKLSSDTQIRIVRSSLDYCGDDEIPSLCGTHYNFDSPIKPLNQATDTAIKGTAGYAILTGFNRWLLDQLIVLLGYVCGAGYYCSRLSRVVPHERYYGFSLQEEGRKHDFRWQPMVRNVNDDHPRVHITQLETLHLEWSARVMTGIIDLAIMLYGCFEDSQFPWFTLERIHPDYIVNKPIDRQIWTDIHFRDIYILDLLSWLEDWLVLALNKAQTFNACEPSHTWAVEQYAIALQKLRAGDYENLIGLSEWITLKWLIDWFKSENKRVEPHQLASISLEFKAVNSPLRDDLIAQFPFRSL